MKKILLLLSIFMFTLNVVPQVYAEELQDEDYATIYGRQGFYGPNYWDSIFIVEGKGMKVVDHYIKYQDQTMPLQTFEELEVEGDKRFYHAAVDYFDILAEMILDEGESKELQDLNEDIAVFFAKIEEFRKEHLDENFNWDTEENETIYKNMYAEYDVLVDEQFKYLDYDFAELDNNGFENTYGVTYGLVLENDKGIKRELEVLSLGDWHKEKIVVSFVDRIDVSADKIESLSLKIEEHKVHKENAHLYTSDSYAGFLKVYEEAEVLLGVLKGRSIVDADVDVVILKLDNAVRDLVKLDDKIVEEEVSDKTEVKEELKDELNGVKTPATAVEHNVISLILVLVLSLVAVFILGKRQFV